MAEWGSEGGRWESSSPKAAELEGELLGLL